MVQEGREGNHSIFIIVAMFIIVAISEWAKKGQKLIVAILIIVAIFRIVKEGRDEETVAIFIIVAIFRMVQEGRRGN